MASENFDNQAAGAAPEPDGWGWDPDEPWIPAGPAQTLPASIARHGESRKHKWPKKNPCNNNKHQSGRRGFRERSDNDGRGKSEKKRKDDFRNSKGGDSAGQDRSKRRKLDKSGETVEGDGAEVFSSRMSLAFPVEEIAAEERRPKRKVAVMIGYAGTGYKGMQINHDEKTIEGDLFEAFVRAGAISKANANDPKKSSLIRCARTDKGVHAAGNVMSLKLIVEDRNIVENINAQLPPQIRVWGIQRTNNSFNCYQACDSRWYEYLLPSYSLLPPHPRSYLGAKVRSIGKEKGVYGEMEERWFDVKDFWEEVEKRDIQPILDKLDPDVRKEVKAQMSLGLDGIADDGPGESENKTDGQATEVADKKSADPSTADSSTEAQDKDSAVADAGAEGGTATTTPVTMTPVDLAIRAIKLAYIAAKRRYRAGPWRLEQLAEALSCYHGSNNFHNYTVQKNYKDPSARRHIKSFLVNMTPICIGDTEWLSLKVHGQSFMMHQIRKMVAMAVMLVRCAAPTDRIRQSFTEARISIPKAPSLGLLLERPVFDNYNNRATNELGKETIDFNKYKETLENFKQDQIYKRIWETEEMENSFHIFFDQLDNFVTNYFLWVTAGGFEAAYKPAERGGKPAKPREGEAKEDEVKEDKAQVLPEDLDAEGVNEDVNPEGGGEG